MPATHRSPAASSKKRSQRVAGTSDALDRPPDVFKLADPRKIAQSIRRSAEHGDRRKRHPYRSAMSMSTLTLCIDRAGHRLEAARRQPLDDAKDELRKLHGKPVPCNSAC